MKIILCGKGGGPKRTIVARLAKYLARNGHPVLVINTDESNLGFHPQPGVNPSRDFTDCFGGEIAALERIMQESPDWDSVLLLFPRNTSQKKTE